MARKLLGSIATLLAGAGLAWGQTGAVLPPPPSGPPQPGQTTPATWVLPTGQTLVPASATAQSPGSASASATVPPQVMPNHGIPSVIPTDTNPSRGSVFLSQPYTDHSRVWASAEYLLWWIRPGSLPPVVGTAPSKLVETGTLPSDVIVPLAGSGSNDLNYHEQSGVRLSLGAWLDNAQDWGVDGSFFQLEQKNAGGSFSSGGDPVIGPTFFDPNTNTQNLVLASLPNFASGPLASQPRSAVIETNASNNLWGAEINLRKQIGAVFFADHLDLLMGFRHLQFSENVDIATDSESLPGNVAPSSLLVADHLSTINQFYGPQVGLASHTQYGRWSLDLIGKLAIGDMHEVENISGSTLLTSPSGTISSNTGILAEPTNIGKTTRERFAVLPEMTINVGYQVIENVRLTMGYNFLYISSVMRAGDLVDGVDTRQVRSLASFDPTAQVTSPQVQQHDSRFWAQGINVGVEVRY